MNSPPKLPDGWSCETQHRGQGTTITFTGPLWPHAGKPGDILYVRVSPSAGWRWLEAGHTQSHIVEASLSAVLTKCPELRPALLWAHAEMEKSTAILAQRWIDRRFRWRAERLAATR